MKARAGHPKSRPFPPVAPGPPSFSQAVGLVASKASLLAVITGASAPQAILAAARALIAEAQRMEQEART